MGLESLQSLQHLHLLVPHSPRKPICARSYSLSSFRSFNNNNHSIGYSFGYKSPLFGSCGNLRTSGLKRSCSADSTNFLDDDDDLFARHGKDFSKKFNVSEEKDRGKSSTNNNSNNNNKNASSSFSSSARKVSKNPKRSNAGGGNDKKKSLKEKNDLFLPSKLEFLEPNLLGIRPEPPEWPERDELVKMSIARKANSVDQIPVSLRMIGKKQKWQEGIVDASDFAYCSIKKAFSSMVFMIRELQSYALSIRGRAYSEDLQAVVNKFQKEMNASFVWLFQQVFSRTPNLMVYVMLLLANFTVHSMVGNMEMNSYPKMYHHLLPTSSIQQILEENSGEKSSSSSVKNPNLDSDDKTAVSSPENQEMTDEEEMELWNYLVEEALKLQQESTFPVIDQETKKQLVSPLSVEIEPEDYMEFHRTDLIYQMGVAEDPDNPLLLSNYAQFLYLVRRDYDRAEECFKRAIMSGPDAEIYSRYADFLWIVRKDLWNAEEVYQQATEAAPDSHYYASKYANFLWNTGGQETCFPLSTTAAYNTTVM